MQRVRALKSALWARLLEAVTAGSTQIMAGDYKLSYEGPTPAVRVTLTRSGSSPIVSTQPFSLLSKKGATDSAFAGERNSMLAVSRHLVSMPLDQLLVGFWLAVSLSLLQITDSHFTIEIFQRSDICFREETTCPLFVPDYVCLEHFPFSLSLKDGTLHS
jgi:hypothetical protein